MKNLFGAISILCLTAVLLGACSSTNNYAKEVLTYDLLYVKEGMPLRFSDLVEDIRMIPLETKPGVLISDGDYRVSDKYIVTITEKAMHQFDAHTGKHIRLLAVAGGGPNEYYYLKSSFISNDKLYYSMAGKKNIYAIDLNTGEHLDPYPTKYEYLEFSEMTENDELYVPNDSVLFERYHVKTHEKMPVIDTLRCLLNGEKKNIISQGIGSVLLNGIGVLKTGREIFYFNQKYSDTLYVQGTKYAQPYMCFRFPIDIPAHRVKEYLRMFLENLNIPDSKKEQIRELDRQLTDESNPVVLIGKKITSSK